MPAAANSPEDIAGARAARLAALAALGARDTVAEELLAYQAPAFDVAALPRPLRLPLADEAFVPTWAAYVAEAAEDGAWPTLVRHLPRLRFPIAAGMSDNADYRAATLRGVDTHGMAAARGLGLRAPEQVSLRLAHTAAGRIPVIVVGDRADFETLMQALTKKNEPVPVPASMGAAMVNGVNNWERVAAHRCAWEARTPAPSAAAWSEEFARLRAQPEAYQDRFVIAQEGWYSAVAAADLGLAAADWRAQSLTIRLAHECTHYLTLRLFGAMRNLLLDELLADYAGIAAAQGSFRADWFLRFMGLEEPQGYRDGGRLQNYRGTPPLSAEAFAVLQHMARRAARTVERFDLSRSAAIDDPVAHVRVVLSLAAHTVDALAAAQAERALEATWASLDIDWTVADSAV